MPNPVNIEMADAQCRMMSSSAERGFVAWGSPEYVTGAHLGNAIGNAVRVDEFMRNCMTTQGWRRVAKQPQKSSTAKTHPSDQITPEMRKKAIDIMAIGHVADMCEIKMSPKARENLKELTSLSGPQMNEEARAQAERSIAEKSVSSSRAAVCKSAEAVIKTMP